MSNSSFKFCLKTINIKMSKLNLNNSSSTSSMDSCFGNDADIITVHGSDSEEELIKSDSMETDMESLSYNDNPTITISNNSMELNPGDNADSNDVVMSEQQFHLIKIQSVKNNVKMDIEIASEKELHQATFTIPLVRKRRIETEMETDSEDIKKLKQ